MEFVLLAAVGVAVWFVIRSNRKSYSYRKHPRPLERPEPVERQADRPSRKNNWGLTDPKNQAAAVAKVNFEKTKLMNASEFRVFAALEKIIADLDEGYRVMAQTSLGEVIKPKSSSGDWKERKNAFASINSKRLDFAVIDKFGFVALAVEYQGSGHHQETAFIRDAVKKEALRRAGIRLLEVEKGTTPKELKQSVLTSLGKNGTDAA